MKTRTNLVGVVFGSLKVLEFAYSANGTHYWLCECDCGGEKIASGRYLAKGATSSCGCNSSRLRPPTNLKHGKSKTVEYVAWCDMKQRCCNAASDAYADYGGRGIYVCERWLGSFENFLADMGCKPKPEYSLERIDNNGNYQPGNCKWATKTEQMANRRKTRSGVQRG